MRKVGFTHTPYNLLIEVNNFIRKETLKDINYGVQFCKYLDIIFKDQVIIMFYKLDNKFTIRCELAFECI